METLKRFAALALVIAGVAWPVLPTFGATSARLPTQQVPKLSLKWLGSLTLSPQTAKAGQSITGTVVLLRKAIENLHVSLRVDGATLNEIGVQVIDNVVVPAEVVIPTDNDRSTFQIGTTANTRFSGNKTYQITASNGSESVSQTFTVSNGLARKLP